MKTYKNMFSTEQLQALRDWVRSEITHSISQVAEIGEDTAGRFADLQFENLTKVLVTEVHS